MSKNEEGSFLVEVLIASVILITIAAGAVAQLTSLTNIKVQTETRDRGLVLANSLHENMQAAGCGFDVGATKTNADTTGQQPWARVGSCAFRAIEHFGPDEDGNVILTGTRDDAKNFCSANGESGICELGDQDFNRKVNITYDNREITYHITVNYWFEKTGKTSANTSCTTGVNPISTVGLPDVIVRKVNVSWPNVGKSGGREDITVIKRQNIPSDSLEFSSSSRVGLYAATSASSVVMIPNIDGIVFTKVTRIKKDVTVPVGNTTFKGGATCVWFPYVDVNSTLQAQFKVDGTSKVPTMPSPLQNGVL